MIMRLAGVGIIASGAATSVFPEMRTLMIPTFAICATIFGITLLSTLSKPKPIKNKTEKTKKKELEKEPSDILMESYEDDSSHLILISSPYFVQQAKITPNKGVTPDSIVKCEASAKGLPEQGAPSIQYSWRNASTGAFLGTRSKLDLKSTLVRPGQSVECLVTAEDDCGDMATSLAKVLIEANLTMPETPTERFNRKELQERRKTIRMDEERRNRGRRITDRKLKAETVRREQQTQQERNTETTVKKRRPLRRVYGGEETSNIFTTSGMWD